MNKCPYCKNTLTIKNLKQGLYGRCPYCRFSGYIPKIEIEEVKTRLEEEEEEEEEEFKPLKCCAKYKTERGGERHWDKVIEERDIHPRIFEKHNKYYDWGY